MADFLSNSLESFKTGLRVLLKSRRSGCLKSSASGNSIVILGNGPSLSDTILHHKKLIQEMPSMAVNFSANTPEFRELKPQYYLLMDPHFFSDSNEGALGELWDNFSKVDWDMTLIVPARYLRSVRRRITNSHISVSGINALAADGWKWLRHILFNLKLGMARPRNVLIPAITSAVWLGYRRIYVVGADHSWLEGLSVTDKNEVVSIQKHYYADSDKELSRVAQVYKDVRLHQVLESMVTAFRSYHIIRKWTDSINVEIINATPQSMIDAFKRGTLGKS